MGKRGPRRKPTALEIARGNPGKRKLNADEPRPEAGAGDCPAWLDQEAKACRAEHVLQLQAMGGLTMVEFRQGYLSMSDPSETFERLVLSGRLRHGERPILR